MKKNVSHDEVKAALKDVDPEHHFRVSDGSIIKNLHGLYNKLIIMDDETFQNHVTKEKNDFYNWIYHIIKDQHLAEQLVKIIKREKMIKIIKKRLDTFNEIQEKYYKLEKMIDDIDDKEDGKRDVWEESSPKGEPISIMEKVERDLELEQLKEDLEEITKIESMGAGRPVSYITRDHTAKEKLQYGLAEFLQGVVLGILIGIIIARAII